MATRTEPRMVAVDSCGHSFMCFYRPDQWRQAINVVQSWACEGSIDQFVANQFCEAIAEDAVEDGELAA